MTHLEDPHFAKVQLLWSLRISPSCCVSSLPHQYVALGEGPTWPSAKTSLWVLWLLVAQLGCFTHQIFGEVLLLLIRSRLGANVGNLKTGGPTFMFKIIFFSCTFPSRDKDASNDGNRASRFHCPHWQRHHNWLVLTGTSNPLLYKRTVCILGLKGESSLWVMIFTSSLRCHRCMSPYIFVLRPQLFLTFLFVVVKCQRSLWLFIEERCAAELAKQRGSSNLETRNSRTMTLWHAASSDLHLKNVVYFFLKEYS